MRKYAEWGVAAAASSVADGDDTSSKIAA